MKYNDWIEEYRNYELSDSQLEIFENDFVREYGRNLDQFKALYFQTIVDINRVLIQVNDNVYYVFGKSLKKGVVEKIIEYKVGRTEERIKITGVKKLFYSNQVVKI